MDLSIIVVSYRTPKLLRTCLEKLTQEKTDLSLEILVVDNDSGDDSVLVAKSFPGVKVVDTGENLGFAGGVNRGLMEASGRFMMIMNPDVEIHSGALGTLVEFLETHPQTGIAAPKLLNSDGSLQYSCRRNYTLTSIILRRTFLGRLFPNAPALRRHLMLDFDHAEPRAVDWVSGAAMMVRREALDDVGPMEERYFLYFEDVDWCTRMQARSWLVYYVPQAVVTHRWQRASLGLGAAARRHVRSGLRFYDRWGDIVYVLRRYRRVWTTIALVLCDLVAFALAFVIAHWLRQQMAFIQGRPVWPLSAYANFFVFNAVIYVTAFFQQGLYREVKQGDWVDVAFRVFKAATLAYVILMATTFVLRIQGYSRVIVIGTWPLMVLFSFMVRRSLNAVLARVQRDRWNLRRVALVGEDPVLDDIERVMIENPELGWDPVRGIRTPWASLPRDRAQVTMVKQLSAERVSEVVLTERSVGVPVENLSAEVLPLRQAGIGVRLVSAFLGSLPPGARLGSIRGIAWLSMERSGPRPSAFSKRALDLAGSVVLLVLGAVPFLGVLVGRAVATKNVWEPAGPRMGRWGETFTYRRLAGESWFRSYPLLVNVLRGQMSLTGPRPLLPGEPIPGGKDWLRVRELYRPGCVGPWSLAPARTGEEEMHQELRYFQESSTEVDLKLLTRVALRRPGRALSSGSVPPVQRDHSEGKPAPAGGPRRTHSTGI
jgi:GT2 family glycosyltransferase/lipopolysaccharide/colanic/teichoic acid biosynthesis glycosyltransferase